MIDEQVEAPEFSAVSPLTAAEALALANSEQARTERDGRVARLRSVRCSRHASCRKYTLAIRRVGNLSESVHVPANCGRFDCPGCQRSRIIRHLNRAVDCLTSAAPDSTAPRQGMLHAWAGPTDRWEAVSKSIRRRAPGCGHCRAKQADGRCLVIAVVPFPGSSPVSVPVAFSLAADAIENMLHEMHSVRWLGAWSVVEHVEEWEVVKHSKPLPEVARLAVELGGTIEEKKGLLGVRFGENIKPEALAAFWAQLRCCPVPSSSYLSVRRIEPDMGEFERFIHFPDTSPPPMVPPYACPA